MLHDQDDDWTDEDIAKAQEEKVHKYLTSDEAIKRYLNEQQKVARFGELEMDETFSFSRSPYEQLLAYKKISETMAMSEKDQQTQFRLEWWVGTFRI